MRFAPRRKRWEGAANHKRSTEVVDSHFSDKLLRLINAGTTRVPVLMRANMPTSGENGSLWPRLRLATAGDTGENAVCHEAQSINTLPEHRLSMLQKRTVGTG